MCVCVCVCVQLYHGLELSGSVARTHPIVFLEEFLLPARWSVWRAYQVVGSRFRWQLLPLDMRSKKKQGGQIDSVLREKTSDPTVTAEAMFRGYSSVIHARMMEDTTPLSV